MRALFFSCTVERVWRSAWDLCGLLGMMARSYV